MKKYFILITFILISNLNLSAQDYFYRLNSGNPIKLNSNLPNSEEENNNPSIYCEGTESINLEDPESGLVLQFYTNIMIDIQQSSVYRPAYGEEDDQEINSGYITCDSIEECYLINDIFTYAIFNLEEHKIMEIFLKNHDHFMELNEVPENIFYNSTNYKTEYMYTLSQPPVTEGAYLINGEFFILESTFTAGVYRLCAE